MTTNVQSFELVGRKEDCSDFMENLTPTYTPFLTSLKSERIRNTIHQWFEDSLRPVAVNAAIQGAAAVDINAQQPSARLNQTQIFVETFRVADTVDAIDVYGRKRDTARLQTNTSMSLKRDLEHALVGTAQAGVVGNATTASQMVGAQAQIDAANVIAGGSAPLDETKTLAALKAVYDAGGDVKVMMIKSADAKKVADFALATGRTRDFRDDRKIVNVVAGYIDPFGQEVRVVVNRFINQANAIFYNPDNFRLLVLRPWEKTVLGKDGDSTRHFMRGEFSLKHTAYKASALINALT